MQTFNQNLLKITILSAVTVLLACNRNPKTVEDDRFKVTDGLIKQLAVDTVQDANQGSELLFSAKITENDEKKSEIFPMVSGNLIQANVKLGDAVIKGQTLAVINSAEIAGFNKESIAAKAELNTAERNYKQAQQLFESGLSSAKELEEAKSDLQIKRAELTRSNAVIKLNGNSKNGLYQIKSPINGFVIQKKVSSNMQIRADHGESIFTIADLSNVYAMINVYESDISKIKQGDEVNITVLAYPDKRFTGKIDKIYNIINDQSNVMNARVTINNLGYLLKPGMLATVKVAAQSDNKLPVLKSDNLIFDNNRYYVIVLDSKNKPVIRQVEIDRKSGNKAYVSKGLEAGERVIASKQVFLYESLKN